MTEFAEFRIYRDQPFNGVDQFVCDHRQIWLLAQRAPVERIATGSGPTWVRTRNSPVMSRGL